MNESNHETVIDLNADIGEGVTHAQRAVEDAVVGFVTSVNIACGGHAGDDASMRRAVQIAARHGVAVGAHPSFPDRANFGRVTMDIDAAALRASVLEQIMSLDAIARAEGVALTHCKPHGALYHAASADEPVALAIHRACAELDADIWLVGQAGSRAVSWWRAWGATVCEEAFADRVYEADGSLRSRVEPGALLDDPDTAGEQACRIATTRTVVCSDGVVIPLIADTLCVHGDTDGAARNAERVARSLCAAGVRLRCPVRNE